MIFLVIFLISINQKAYCATYDITAGVDQVHGRLQKNFTYYKHAFIYNIFIKYFGSNRLHVCFLR